MNSNAFRATTALFVLATSAGLLGCIGDTGGESSEDVGQAGRERLSFEDWAKQNLVEVDGMFYFEGDIRLTSEQAHKVYDAVVSPSGALYSYAGTVDGLDKFTTSQQHNLTWCIASDQFTSAEFTRIQKVASQAMGAWEAVADVRFIRVTGQDSTCSTSGRVIRIVNGNATLGGNAAAGDPPGGGRQLRILTSEVDNDTDSRLLAVFEHELGHMLGFGHESDRPTDGTTCAQWAAAGANCGAYDSPRDSSSVMYRIDAGGYTGAPGGGGWNYITQWDLEGSQKVYGAPTDVVNTQNGVVFARQLSTGDFCRRQSDGTWAKIGGPGQTFLTLGNTLYGQTPGGGYLVRYQSGQTWIGGLSGANGQVLRCANAICATNPNTQQIARYDGTSWTYIGGGGARFAGTDTQLFGIVPHQDGVAVWSGSGGTWFYAGNTTETARELAGGGTSMYRIPTESLGHIERWDGSTWADIGSFSELRQVHASGSGTYAINGFAVYSYNGSSWVSLNPPAAITRLFGSYGYVYGTASDDTIYAYSAGTWTSLGKP
jgi:hypothetical protein